MVQQGFRVLFATVIFLSCTFSAELAGQPLQTIYQAAGPLDSAQLAISIERSRHNLESLELTYGGYDPRLNEALMGLGRQLQSAEDLTAARAAYTRAWQISRINAGLFNPDQVAIISRLIEIDSTLEDWEAVDKQYAYLENLFGKLYDPQDPRLERSLRPLVAWHLNASNGNLDGRRIEHLRSLTRLYKLRHTVALNTRGPDDPLVDYLKQRIMVSEYHLYASSRVISDKRLQSFYTLQERYLLTLE